MHAALVTHFLFWRVDSMIFCRRKTVYVAERPRSSIVGFSVGAGQCWRCWWADKVQWDASQAPRDLATEHLSKCGQTDESRLGALPPKGRVTFSGDNMGLQ